MIEIGGKDLDLAAFGRVVHARERCALAAGAVERMDASRRVIESVVGEDRPIYGVNTGFGHLAEVRIPLDKLRTLQERLLASHAAGVGEPLADDAVAGMLLLRAQALARGYSGVRPAVVERLVELLNRRILPLVPSRGSVGASGDLAPLAHLALPLVGRGRVRIEGKVLEAAEALEGAGLEPLVLEPKEGLALINGTQAMAALLALALGEARRLVKVADLVGALSTDAFRGTDTAFDERIHRLRPHPGQLESARNLWSLLQGSAIRDSHRTGDMRVQDPYSFRCMPQVHGAVRQVVADSAVTLEREMNAVTDNPLVFPETGEVLSGGNFHGEPLALAADAVAVALAELGAISERRIEKLTNPAFSGLPAFLVRDVGLNSGLMLAQVTAAAVASENKVLSHPASVDSLSTSADTEDHVSMGMGAALKLQTVVGNARRILAIELLSAAQGIDLLRPLESSPPLEALHRAFRNEVPVLEEDRQLSLDLETAEAFVKLAIDTHLGELA